MGETAAFGRDDRQKALAIAGDVVLLFSAESGIAKNASAEQHDRGAGLNRIAARGSPPREWVSCLLTLGFGLFRSSTRPRKPEITGLTWFFPRP